MDFILSLPGRISSLFYDPSPGPHPTRRHTTLTRLQLVTLVCVTATVYIVVPDYLQIKKLVFVPFLGRLAGALFDLREALLAAWENAPRLLKRYMPPSTNSADDNTSVLNGLDLGGIWGTMTSRLGKLAIQVRVLSAQFRRTATTRLGELAAQARKIVVQLRRLVREAAIKLLQGALLRLLSPPPGHKPGAWHGVLVRTPPVHDYGLRQPLYIWGEPTRWENYCDISAIPPMTNSLSARSHLSFCLIRKSVWECRCSSVLEKLMTGLYWDIEGKEAGDTGDLWNDEQVRSIIGLKDLGLVETEPGLSAVQSCHRHFAHLRSDWKYKEIFYNDVDFAIILSRLVTGQGEAFTLGSIFAQFERLRLKEILEPREKKHMTADSKFGQFLEALPTIVDWAMWDQRKIACRDLVTKCQRLDAVFDVEAHFPR